MMFRALVRRLLHRGPGQPGTRIAPYRELVRGLTHWAKSGVHPAGAGESDLWERLAALTAKRRQDIIALSLEDVLARHPERVVDEMFDRISEKAETGLELRPKEQAMAALLMLQGEVNNGGFHQYFLNPGGRYAQEALAGAEMLGFESLTTLVQEAMGRFAGGRPPEDRRLRILALERLGLRAFSDLDDRFYELGDEKINSYFSRWVAEHLGDLDLTGRQPG